MCCCIHNIEKFLSITYKSWNNISNSKFAKKLDVKYSHYLKPQIINNIFTDKSYSNYDYILYIDHDVVFTNFSHRTKKNFIWLA